jgi:uncharacterized delta-60 repeat protein
MTRVVTATAFATAAVLLSSGVLSPRASGAPRVLIPRASAASGLDPSFGPGGVVVTRIDEPQDESFTGVRRLRDGSLLAAGGASYLHIVRWSSAGRLQIKRRVTTTLGALFPTALAQRPDGSLIGAGTNYYTDFTTFGVGAFTPRGRAVASFGHGGLASRFDFPDSHEAQARAVVPMPDNGAVVGGYAIVRGQPVFALARLDASGRLDPTFGSSGLVTTAIPGTHERPTDVGAVQTSINALLRQGDGRLLAVGSAIDARSRRPIVVVARYLPDGALDITYGRRGITTTSFQDGQASIANVAALQPVVTLAGVSFRLVVAGVVGPIRRAEARPGLLRLLDDGRLDRSFGRRGRQILDVHTDAGVTGLHARRSGELLVSASLEYKPENSGFMVGRLTKEGRLNRAFGGAGISCIALRNATLPDYIPAPERNVTSVVEQPRGGLVLGGLVDDLGGTAQWVLARFKPRFSAPIGCFSVQRARQSRGTIVRAALARRGRLVADVAELRGGRRPLKVGFVSFGHRARGLVALRWNLRVHGVRLRRGRSYTVRPRLVDSRGRTIGRTDSALVIP